MVERTPGSTQQAIPVSIVSSNGFLPHAVETGLAASARIEFSGHFLKWQSLFEFLKLKSDGSVNVILADRNGGNPDVFKWVETVREAIPSTAIVALIGEDDEDAVNSALQVGVSGYLAPPFSVDQLASAIISVANGEFVLSPSLMKLMLSIGSSMNSSYPITGLTSRESDILRLLASGNSVKEIAHKLSISYFTADTHIKNLHRKFSVSSSHSLISIALRKRLI